MPGLAETLFNERCGITQQIPMHWPELEALVTMGQLQGIDLAFAKRWLPQGTQGQAAVLCHLMHSARNGHICIQLENGEFSPNPRDEWLPNLPEFAELELDIRIPEELITEKSLNDHNTHPAPTTPLCRCESKIYLQRLWLDESLFVKHWQRLMAEEPTVKLSEENLQSQLQELEEKSVLAPDQILAVRKACQHAVTIITGGPGTGKTYTAGQFIRILRESLPADAREHFEIALAAPTGKAAAALQSSLQKALGDDCSLQATTLHRLLGIRQQADLMGTSTGISADLVLIDECSMIDARLMARLFSAVKSGARLILLGDKDQLPPVEAGQLFHDISCLSQLQDSVAQLTQSRRMKHQGLTQLAAEVCAGKPAEALACLDGRFAELRWKQEIHHQALMEEVKPLYTQVNPDPEVLLGNFSEFRLLSPLRNGPLGVNCLNQEILSRAEERARSQQQLSIPILIIRNSPKDELFNGDVGILTRQRKGDGSFSGPFLKGDYALFSGLNGVRRIPAALLPPFDYAYCLSVHKSQGSEFKKVLLVLPEGSQVFGREVLYTAITRAREEVAIAGTAEILRQTIENRAQRQSGFALRIS